jgi:16S rRNA (cytosine967-C5)-methyltransferase
MRWHNRLVEHAVVALARVARFEHAADGELSRYFRDNGEIGHGDRGAIAESVYAILRHWRSLTAACGGEAERTPRRLFLAWLVRHEGANLREIDQLLRGGERDWLAGVKAFDAASLSAAERCELPDWLYRKLVASRGEAATAELAGSLQRPAPLDLRINPLKTDRESVQEALAEMGVATEPTPYSPLGLRAAGKPALAKNPLFLDGRIEVQDEGSQLLGLLLGPKRGEMVVDFCAGAGGKTMLLGALMRSTGRLYAFDVSDKRLAKLKPRLARSGLSNVHAVRIDSENDPRVKRLAGKIDRVLVDAPCSGLGTIRRNPDLKIRQDEASVARLTATQAAILAAAARLLKPGGRLVYATCSLLDAENDAVVDAFLAAHPGFAALDAGEALAAAGVTLPGERLRLSPVQGGTDGFFAALLERRHDARKGNDSP